MVSDSPVLAIEGDQKEVLAIKRGELLAETIEKLARVLELWICGEGIFRFSYQHDPVTGKHVLESLHG